MEEPQDRHEEVHVVDADGGAAPATGSPAAEHEAAAVVEAVLFATDSPLTIAKIAQVAELPAREVRLAVDALNARYEQAGSAFRVEAIAGGYQMLTLPQYHDVLSRLLRARSDTKLSQAAMETLAIIAYRQPVLRADVEAIRGVACGEVLRGLMEKQLVKIVARAEVLGRPMLYGTTRRFLEVFGLNSLDDLPKVEELRSGAPEKTKQSPAPIPQVPGAPGEQTSEDIAERQAPNQAPAPQGSAPPENAETKPAEG
jgi:segregation and condensation protein B